MAAALSATAALLVIEDGRHLFWAPLLGFDVATVSHSHINRLFLSQFSPLRGAPELVDALVKAPMLVTEGLRVLESTTRRPPQNPFTGIRGTIFVGFALAAGAVVLGFGGPWPLWAALFALALILAFRRT